jgi:hypothetical protein
VAGRRGNNEGAIYQRSADGRWCGVALLGYDVRGRMVRKTVTAKSRAEVTRKLAHLRREVDAGRVSTSKTLTLAELMTRWFEDVLSREVALSTYDNYHAIVKYHVLPALGKRKLTDIKVADVDRLLAAKLTGGLSPSTVHRIRALISGSSDSGGVLTVLIGRRSSREPASWACRRKEALVFGSSRSSESQSRSV